MIVLATGVVYGDIGTSPLYTPQGSLFAALRLAAESRQCARHPVADLWSLIWVVTLKYITFNACRQPGRRRHHGAHRPGPACRPGSPRLATTLVLLGLFGAALFYGDSMITPAVSVLSAVEGLELAFDGLEAWVVPIALVILVGIFAIQKRGTATIGKFFGPVMVLWFTTLGARVSMASSSSPRCSRPSIPTGRCNSSPITR